MNEKAYLLVDILEEVNQHMKVRSYFEDDTSFELMVSKHDVTKMPSSSNPAIHPNRGWLLVDYSGEANQRASITLPAPILNQGKRITVSSRRINRTLQESKPKQNVEELYQIVDVVPEETPQDKE